MSANANNLQPGDGPHPSDETSPDGDTDIVSVNRTAKANNHVARAAFVLLVVALLVGVTTWFGQTWLESRKAELKGSAGPKVAQDQALVFNPERTGAAVARPRLGSDSGLPPPSQVAASGESADRVSGDDGATRPLRGADGKVMINAQGRAMGVDKNGNVVEVPAIAAIAAGGGGRKPLPGQSSSTAPQGMAPGAGAGQPAARPPSRFGGSLFVGDPVMPSGSKGSSDTQPSTLTPAQIQAQQIAEILRAAAPGGAADARAGRAAGAPLPGGMTGLGSSPGGLSVGTPDQPRPGTVGSTLFSSATPVATARRSKDPNLILPKGRQADCVLTGRIVDEVPGFTSCVLAQNMYSDNGRVLLLERGSELIGEYGVTNQLGLERLFVTWTRLKTPEGVEVDLASPGADRLGTTGLPGQLDNRWGERIGAALLLSFVKDVTVAIINKQSQADSDPTVSVQTAPAQNTLTASSALAEEVIKQTLKVRPRLSINEGDRISVYVARDLDFSSVYGLQTASAAVTTTGAAP